MGINEKTKIGSGEKNREPKVIIQPVITKIR